MKLKEKMLSLLSVVLMAFALLSVSYHQARAISPWTSQPVTIAPVQGTIFNCSSVFVSSITSTQLLAANATREAMYVINVSSTATIAGSRPSAVFISSYAITATATNGPSPQDLTGTGAYPLWSADFRQSPSSATIQTGSKLEMNGGAVYQGPVFALSDSLAGRAIACEINP